MTHTKHQLDILSEAVGSMPINSSLVNGQEAMVHIYAGLLPIVELIPIVKGDTSHHDVEVPDWSLNIGCNSCFDEQIQKEAVVGTYFKSLFVLSSK